jgi:hypothetical protein
MLEGIAITFVKINLSLFHVKIRMHIHRMGSMSEQSQSSTAGIRSMIGTNLKAWIISRFGQDFPFYIASPHTGTIERET